MFKFVFVDEYCIVCCVQCFGVEGKDNVDYFVGDVQQCLKILFDQMLDLVDCVFYFVLQMGFEFVGFGFYCLGKIFGLVVVFGQFVVDIVIMCGIGQD